MSAPNDATPESADRDATRYGPTPSADPLATRYSDTPADVDPAATRYSATPADLPGAHSPTAGDATLPGRRFRVLRPHAKGGLGEVFVARDEELHREVALKEIQGRYADDPESRARFLVEAEITGGLEHPGVVPVYGLGQYDDGRPFYTMRFIRGDSLKEAIARFHKGQGSLTAGPRALELRQLLGRFNDVCDAIAYAHSRGVLHRDLKPGNVMLGKYGETLVVDWGLAKPLKATEPAPGAEESALQPSSVNGSSPTRMGVAVGTPPYMAPEQAAGRLDQMGPASDVYALGATLYCLLTGKPPFENGELETVLQRVRRGDFPRPREVRRDVPPALEAVCLKAMALRPADRYPTARALAADVEKWLADEPTTAYREPWRVRVGRWARRRQTLVASSAAGLLVALSAGGAGALWYQQDRAARAAERAIKATATSHDVTAALEEASLLGKQATTLTNDPVRWEAVLSEALSAVKRAEGLLNSGEGTDELRSRVASMRAELEAAEKDRRMVARLEEARFQEAAGGQENGFDDAGASALYARAFREDDASWEHLDIRQAAEAINKRAIREELLDALAAWSTTTPNQKDQRRLRDILADADPDAGAFWNRLNAAVVHKDLDGLRRLAFGPEAGNQPAVRAALLGAQLTEVNAADAVKFLKVANEQHPGDFWILFELAHACYVLKPPLNEESARYITAALALRPGSSVAHYNLGQTLDDEGKREEAAAEYRKALALDPHFALAHNNLGNFLDDQGKRDEATAEYREAIKLDPKFAMPHYNLGNILGGEGKSDEAIAEFRKAIEINPKIALAHINLGAVLSNQGKREEAAVEFRKAIGIDPNFAPAYSEFGMSLLSEGKFTEARQALQRSLKLLPADDPMRKDILPQLQQCEQMLALDNKLAAILRGEAQPADAQEQLSLARLCSLKKRYADAFRFFADAFAAQPSLADDLAVGARYDAACSAALTASDQGEGADKRDDKERARLRRQALDWLRADLALWGKQAEGGAPQAWVALQQKLRHCQEDPDLASVRDEAALNKLPEAERADWMKLWADVDALLKKSGDGKPKE